MSRAALLDRPSIWLCSGLVGANIAVWLTAFAALHGHPALLATALLAWVFGLRHAIDADHIAAIDNVVRKLMQQGTRPLTVGFWFSLGHSTIVVAASAAVAATSVAVRERLEATHLIGSVVGTLVSGVFLFAIAVANLIVLARVWRAFRKGGSDLSPLQAGGLLTRLTKPIFGVLNRPWQMYPIGVLFGLGFDTATEIGLLGISATQAAHGLSPWRIMVFPALFTAGMALVDSIDSILMVRAYGWAFLDPRRKMWYNLTITAASVLVAVLIGGVETLGLLADQLSLQGRFWHAIQALNDRFGYLGAAAIFIFVACWAISAWLYRRERPIAAA